MPESVRDAQSDSTPVGKEVVLEGRITDLLPFFNMAGDAYERMRLEDETGAIVVVLESSPKYFLPGDVVRVRGRVRPCPYSPMRRCVESSADEIEILEPKWIRPEDRRELDQMGPFSLQVLLHSTSVDEEIMPAILSTRLDPVRMAEEFRSRISAGKGVGDLVDLLAAMTLYSIFFRRLENASVALSTISMVRGMDLPPGVGERLDLLASMLGMLVSQEGLAPYVSEPESAKGAVELYPTPGEVDVSDLPEGVRRLVEEVAGDLRGGRGGFFVVEFDSPEELRALRAAARAAAGAAEGRLIYSPVDSLKEDPKEVAKDLDAVARSEGGPTLVYLEGIEVMVPSPLFLKSLPEEFAQAAAGMKHLWEDVLRRLGRKEGLILVVATPNSSLIDPEILKSAKVIKGAARGAGGGGTEEELPYSA